MASETDVSEGSRVGRSSRKGLRSLIAEAEIDTRLVGMTAALLIIWIGFDVVTGGLFITPRNLFNLSLQAAAVAVMATGMVLVLVTRNVDLSVGSLLGVLAMVMGAVQVYVLPDILGYGHPLIWVLTLLIGMLLGGLIGLVQGSVVAFGGVPSFIVTLGGLLIWRGAAWWVTEGQTIAPLDDNFNVIGGGVSGTIGPMWSWVIGVLAIVLVIAQLWNARRRRRKFGFPLRPLWAEGMIALLLAAATVAVVATMNAYPLPERIAQQVLEARGVEVAQGQSVELGHGLAVPVLILAGVAIAIALLARRTRFGRHVFAIGGNPDAAELAGVRTRRTVVLVFALMGVLCAVAAAITSARLQAASNDLGTLDELRVIAAAVIGGTSLGGGIGSVIGAVLGAVVMQSLQSGMALVGIAASLQNIVIGLVLILAVYLDRLYQRRK
ncbi:sugar ABC transporter permease [Rhodovibrio salinarum]|uniref:Xylose transport system permease protein XylH n=1 Tax=Rhodovibrio salinarum TaxID=1087 RepID=A0A934QI88_9PROT|nr:sugar ABC transporter permease [Rhodovibrio salinarum]MBK1697384.1 sugar ABC transporter permease [Rhodovibrio salinarum]